MTLAIPKLHNDGSNWADYEPRIQRALGSKGLWRHVKGTAIAPKPYALVPRVPVLADGTTQATEDQIEAREMKIIDYDKREYLAQHIILSTTSTHLGNKIKNLKTLHDMWDVAKADAMMKSTLFLLNVEDQLASMKLTENDDPKAHLTEVKQHFQLMGQRHDNLLKMSSTISDSRYNTIIMSSLPESYRPTLQTITAVEQASTLLGTSSSRAMKPDDIITFITEEAQHRVINDERTKNAESTLAALGKKQRTGKHRSNKGKEKSTPGTTCENCKNAGHTKANCWAKGGGKEGQGPRGQNSKKGEKKAETAAAAEATSNADEIFTFTCTSDYVEVANTLNVPKSRLGACIDSGTSQHYSPDRDAFINYSPINNTTITTADGRKLKALGKGNVQIELPNGTKRTKTILKEVIHAPDMAFTLILVGRLDNAKCSATFSGGMCTIHNPSGRTMATIPCANGLYHITAPEDPPTVNYASIAMVKLTISEAHQKLGHIAPLAIKYAIAKGHITGIQIDPESKPEFCEACAKAKAAWQPFPKESETRATKYGERVHWDLWGPASVRSLSRNSYVAARIDDATCKTVLYFQAKKSQTIDSYKCDEALIETQTRNRIKVACSNRGGEFLSDDLTWHQDMRGTKCELTVHNSPQQNGVAERGMRTHAECTRALLLASGLPRFLWEEAMKHAMWLQNCTPAHAIDGKTPYKMQHKKKPHLAGIQEFRVAAYVKDLKAGKLDARTKVGRFVGYDSESKGYQIYWPQKRSITVKHNVVFNESNVTANDNILITAGNAVDEGERDKILQPPTSNTNVANAPNSAPAPQPKVPDIALEPALEPEPQNSVPFPSKQEPAKEPLPEPLQEEDPQPELG